MQKIFRILVLMLTTALVACGGGGGSSGSNPNQTTLVTTAGTEVILPVGAAREYQINGGVPPYRIGNADQSIAIGQVSGNTLAIGAVSAGSTKINVFDNSGASVAIDVKVGSSVPLYTTAPSSLTIGVGANVARTFWVGGGGAPYTVEGGDSNVAVVQMLSGTQWKVTGVAKGSTTIKIRDAAGVEVSIGLEVGSPELTISPTDLVIPVGLDAVAKISGGQPPYRVAGGIPAAITAVIQGDELHIKGSLASELEISVIDAAGQTVKVKVEINTATTSIRLSPSQVSVSENDTQPIQFSIFGATGAICVFTSDPTFLQPTVPGCATRSTVTLETGTRGSRCVTNTTPVLLTVVDANRSVGTAQITIVDNGSCGNLSVLPASAQVQTGATTQLVLKGGSGRYVVSSDNPRVATATASGVVVVLTGGAIAGNATITIRDESDISKVVTLPVTVTASTTPGLPGLTTSPQTVTLQSGASADVLLSGGSGKYDFAVSNSATASATLTGNKLTITAGAINGTATVTVRDQADSSRSVVVSVTVNGGAGSSTTLAASPQTLTVQSGAAADVLLSGGSGKFDFAVSNTAVATAKLDGNKLTVTAGMTSGTATVTVRDLADQTRMVVIRVTVNTGAGPLTPLSASPSILAVQSGASADVLLNGGSGKYDFATSNSAVATAVLAVNKLTVTAGTTTGSATVTVRDQTDATRIVVIPVTVTAGPAPAKPMTASPSAAAGSVSETLRFLLQGGTAPYSVVVSNPSVATVTLPVADNLVNVELKQAGQATLVVTDANGQTLNIQVTSNQAQQASLRFAPSAFEIGEDSLLPVTLTVFGGTPPYRAETSDLTLSSVNVTTNPTTGLTEFTVGLGSNRNRCIDPQTLGLYLIRGEVPVKLTVVDSGGSFATSVMTIRDNGTGLSPAFGGVGVCPIGAESVLITTAGTATSILLGSSRNYAITGGVQSYTVATSNGDVATVALTSQTEFSITGVAVGTAVVTIRDAASAASTIVVTVRD